MKSKLVSILIVFLLKSTKYHLSNLLKKISKFIFDYLIYISNKPYATIFILFYLQNYKIKDKQFFLKNKNNNP